MTRYIQGVLFLAHAGKNGLVVDSIITTEGETVEDFGVSDLPLVTPNDPEFHAHDPSWYGMWPEWYASPKEAW